MIVITCGNRTGAPGKTAERGLTAFTPENPRKQQGVGHDFVLLGLNVSRSCMNFDVWLSQDFVGPTPIAKWETVSILVGS